MPPTHLSGRGLRNGSKMDDKIMPKILKKHTGKPIPKSSTIHSKSWTFRQKSSKMHSMGVFGAKSRPDRLQDTRDYSGSWPFGDFLAANVASRVEIWIPLVRTWIPNHTCEHGLAPWPSKIALKEGARKKHEILSKIQCGNRRHLMAQNHVWRYTLRL